MFLLNEQPIGLDTAFTHNEIQYPANWIRLASPEERAAIGITEVADLPTYDDRFYWASGEPKDIDMLKTYMISQVKTTAGTMLAPTDWKVIRAQETGVPLEATLLSYRASIREASNTNETAISACTIVDELAILTFNWPV